MYGKEVLLYCLAYIAGLLIAAGIGQYWLTISLTGIMGGAVLLKVAPRYRWWGLRSRSIFIILLIIVIAFVSFDYRFPRETSNDVSKIIPRASNGINVTVIGKVLNAPTVNRSGKLRFWLEADAVAETPNPQPVTGKLYTTIPESLVAGVQPGSKIEVTGYLYQPQAPRNPGQFDFRDYLHRHHAFAGISGREVAVLTEGGWGFWQLRDRVIQVHQQGLGSPEGELVSSMVLGRKAVNLPHSIQDQFLQGGLAHILAASGFHVSLLLAVVLGMTQRLQVSLRFGIGLGILVLYVGLTGLQPSILRASLMGVAGLLGLLTERKVNSTRSLLVIATILLFINPLWILDLGFQFSFLATLGLIVTLPPLLKRFEFLPPTIASVVAVPIAVFPWVFPLQLFHFGTVATYSILLNVLATPLGILLILGGMLSGFIGLLIPSFGSAIAQFLDYPAQGLIDLVSGFNQLPGSYLLFGKLALWQLLIVAALIIFIWQSARGSQYWKPALVGGILVIILPISYQQFTLKQVTVFATEEPVILIQHLGETTLINCGDEDTIRYTLLPFLKQEGIQSINHAIALSSNNNWHQFANNIRLQHFFYNPTLETEFRTTNPLPVNIQQRIPLQQFFVQQRGLAIHKINPMLLKIVVGKQAWGLLSDPTPIPPRINPELRGINLLLWQGQDLSSQWLEQLTPQHAIAISDQISRDLKDIIAQQNIDFYFTGKHGAIQWQPRTGLRSWLDEF